MTNVVEFSAKEHHVSGECRCIECGHEWVGVAPLGANQLECPECKTTKGVFKHPIIPDKDVRTCNCGNDLFWITKEALVCYKCGVEQSF